MEVRLMGNTSKKYLEERIKIIASAGKLSRFKGNVFEVVESCNDYNKNLDMIKRIINMGHKSIIEHDYLVFALSDVTPIIEQIIIGYRLTSFTIKSRREVDFSQVGFYVPNFRNENGTKHKNNKKLQEQYKNHMTYLFSEYSKLIDLGINKEDARFILPYSYYSNIIMGLDARELEKMTKDMLYSPISKISEIHELGEKLLGIIKNSVPYLYDIIINYQDKENGFDVDSLINKPLVSKLDKPHLICATEHIDNQIIIAYLMGKYQCDNITASRIVDDLKDNNPEKLSSIMSYIVNKTNNRELEYIDFQFQIPISLAVLTHLTRHRMHSLIIPDFTPIWDLEKYQIPKSIQRLCEKKYHEIYNTNINLYQCFKNEGIIEEDLIYFYLSGNMCNVVTSINGRALEWICKMRCCTKAQWEIRAIANEMASLVKKVAPLYGKHLGPTCITKGYCPEGKECCGLIYKINKVED